MENRHHHHHRELTFLRSSDFLRRSNTDPPIKEMDFFPSAKSASNKDINNNDHNHHHQQHDQDQDGSSNLLIDHHVNVRFQFSTIDFSNHYIIYTLYIWGTPGTLD